MLNSPMPEKYLKKPVTDEMPIPIKPILKQPSIVSSPKFFGYNNMTLSNSSKIKFILHQKEYKYQINIYL